MLGRGRDARGSKPAMPAHLAAVRPQPKAPLARPEPDYEVVEFPSDQYVNAKLQPPPPPPRPPAGHPEAVAPCGLCGGGGARVRCIECGKRPLCASCDEMYHRHPKRRNHHRQILPFNQQLSEVRPPLPPKVIAPPVPPPRRHKIGDRMSASPKPPTILENRRATVGSVAFAPQHLQTATLPLNTHVPHPALVKSTQPKFQPSYMGSMPYLPTHHTNAIPQQTTPITPQTGTWVRPRASFPGYLQHNPPSAEMWESPEPWSRPMRRGASVLELNQSTGGGGCAGCGQSVGGGPAWRYGSCQSLENDWGAWPATCCLPPHPGHHAHPHPHAHIHPSHTPQPYRRMDSRATSRAVSRAASRAGSRAASPAASVRSHRSRRAPPRTPSPPPLPSSDADSESDGDSDHRGRQTNITRGQDENSLGAPPPPPHCTWQCEHCTYVNEPGVRVCAVCCKTPTTTPKIIAEVAANAAKLNISDKPRAPSVINEQRRAPLNGAEIKPQANKERISTGCGPSPPREEKKPIAPTIRENQVKERHDMGVGPSPPKEIRQTNSIKEVTRSPVMKHNVSVGPSPPRDNSSRSSLETSSLSTDKRSTERGATPSRYELERRPSSRASVANTGTSPPPQSISTQTYEVPSSYDRERAPSRSRSRRRFRDDTWRERSHSRHSLSSDTKESSRSGGVAGRWAWQDEVESPGPRRASLLDLRRTAPAPRHQLASSEMISPSNRAMSLETLSVVGRRDTERGLELARLMNEAEALGFSAAEVHAALAQNPLAPLSWLKERWGGLVGSVQEAAARLAPGAAVPEREARAALARARGAVWPAVTACLHRVQMGVGEEGRLRGRVWGSPAGAELEAAPAARADDSSDEFDGPTTTMHDDDWMYLPLDDDIKPLNIPKQYVKPEIATPENDDVTYHLKKLLKQAGVSHIDETLLLQGLLAEANRTHPQNSRQNNLFLGQSENDFIEAYNALTKSTKLTTQQENNFVINHDFDRSSRIADNYSNHNSNPPNSLANLSASTTLAALNTTPSSHSSDANISTSHQNIKESTLNKSAEVKYKSNANTRKINQQKHRDTSDSDDEYYSKRKLNNPKKNNSMEQAPLNIQTIAHFKNSNEDKTSNLSDIVDHTQKLIQQMKEEIHSDINSLDERNMIRSDESNNSCQSDVSTEHESSYSESLEDTESESDEKNIGRKKEVSDGSSQYRPDKLNRTSSEDNEQFEEAMDHIEPIDTFEQTNIHILDSIARSLQTDQVISIENNEQIFNISNKAGEERREDYNNNIFSAVNSFEEIYQELNSDNFNTQTKAEIARQDIGKHIQIPTIKKVVYVKEPINVIQFQPEQITQFQVLEYKDPVHKAMIEVIETPSPVPISIPNEIEEKLLPVQFSDTEETHTLVNLVIRDKEIIRNSQSSTQVVVPVAFSEIQNQEPAIEHADDLSNYESKLDEQSNLPKNTKLDQKRKITDAPNGPTSDTTSKKSNIPKLIKVLQNTKSKLDRHFPKVIASKVPVRRPSLKSHQAPGPPKSHFGNIYSGQVKQLQSKLFNNKVYKPPTKIVIPEPKPTTSSANIIKKKPAPQPPTATDDENLPSPSKILPTKEKPDKKTYFRETCRTEDEWSDSDSDSSQVFKRDSRNDEPERPRSPPPPVTLRRVSGNLIDLATIRLPEGSPERQARMLLAEGAIETWEQAELAVDLAGRGTDLSSALLAALECTDLDSALVYLNQECELCASRLAEHEMVSMLRCTHRCCRECARHYFTVQITERSIIDCVCPYCKEPELESLPEDAWLEYFAHLDILLKTLIDIEVHELFQRKLRDRTLARDPNFKWCVECSSGFFVHPKQKKLRCPECRSISCASCRKPWSVNHEDLTCEEYSAWLEDNDPEKSIAAVQQHLKENGLDCPRCHFKYSLSRGGCMHFTCTQCKFEFCFGCGKPFTMGARCGVSDYCAKLGLHAHHPRNCLFYLRDKEPHELQTLLQMNNVPFETEAASGGNSRCPVALQRETPAGLADTTCGADVPPLHAGMCKNHYLEYLSRCVRAKHLDPLPILGVDDLETIVRRAAIRLPPKPYGSLEGIYKKSLYQIVKEKIPLE